MTTVIRVQKRSLCCGAIWLLYSAGAFAQSLQVPSPAKASRYAPGDTINITVTAQGSFDSVTVVGQDMGTAPLLSSPPYVLTLTTRNEISGKKTLTAVGFTSGGLTVFSAPISIDVESSAVVASLKPNLTTIHFRYIGQQIKVTPLATFNDGSAADVSSSSRITYTSQNMAVVTVAPDGTLTATGVGQTTVTIASGSVS